MHLFGSDAKTCKNIQTRRIKKVSSRSSTHKKKTGKKKQQHTYTHQKRTFQKWSQPHPPCFLRNKNHNMFQNPQKKNKSPFNLVGGFRKIIQVPKSWNWTETLNFHQPYQRHTNQLGGQTLMAGSISINSSGFSRTNLGRFSHGEDGGKTPWESSAVGTNVYPLVN